MTSQATMVPRWMRLSADGSWKPIGEGSVQSRAGRHTVRDSLTNDLYDDDEDQVTRCRARDSLQTIFRH